MHSVILPNYWKNKMSFMTKSSLKNIPVQTETIVSHPVTGVKCSAVHSVIPTT